MVSNSIIDETGYTVYLLTNLSNGKIYVGQTKYPLHIRMGKAGSNYKNSTHLYNAITKAIEIYGTDSIEKLFTYYVLKEHCTLEEANFYETKYIQSYNTQNPDIGYNIKDGGSNGGHSAETAAKIQATCKEIQKTPEQIEHIRQLGYSWAGKIRGPHSEEWKEENSERMIEWHANNEHPMLGRHQTPEAVQKIAEALTGQKKDPESIKRGAEKRSMLQERELAIVKAYQDGINISEIEVTFGTSRGSIYRKLDKYNIPRLNNFSKWTGKTHSQETKDKQSAARQQFWDEKKV
jgi:group I intron endonuclease